MSEEVWANFDDVWRSLAALNKQLMTLEARVLELERDRQQQLIAAAIEAMDEYMPLADESKHSHLK
jgi:phage-related minor tail protein